LANLLVYPALLLWTVHEKYDAFGVSAPPSLKKMDFPFKLRKVVPISPNASYVQ
jgi:hypothetical protein